MNRIPHIAYSINNMYFMGIQAGIQAYHSSTELGLKCNQDDTLIDVGNLNFTPRSLFNTWAKRDKTVCILNGGPINSLLNTAEIIEESSFPSARFYETDCAFDCFSSITIICPNAKEVMKRRYVHKHISEADLEMFDTIASLRFAT